MKSSLRAPLATAEIGEAGYVVVAVYMPNAYQDQKPPIVNVFGPYDKPEANREGRRITREHRKERHPGVFYVRVRPILRDDMFGILQEDGKPYPKEES